MKKHLKFCLFSSVTLACLQVSALGMEVTNSQDTLNETHSIVKQPNMFKNSSGDYQILSDNKEGLKNQNSMIRSEKEIDEAYLSLRSHPPSPWQMANFYADYIADLEKVGSTNLTFSQYLSLVHKGRSCLSHLKQSAASASSASNIESNAFSPYPSRVAIPTRPLKGELNVITLLIDFPDLKGTQAPKYYERMLFSEKILQTGSMRDYYSEVSGSNLKVIGKVHGWIRMPQNYSYYTNKESGMEWNSYPRNAPRMAEDAVQAALNMGILFNPNLDALKNGSITALFLIHAGRGAEVLPKREGQKNIWSHKWNLRKPITVAQGLKATTYLTVPYDCMVGVCAHELGHLAMGWDDFYDPNYSEDGKLWDGAGNWDLMAGGSYGGGGTRPVHPMGFHKLQHGWVKEDRLNVSKLEAPQGYTLYPFNSPKYSVLNLTSDSYTKTQNLLLEYRRKTGFDSEVPGEGLLVWRIDTSKEQTSPDFPALLLIQADGKHNLEDGYDNNAGDGGDPFPGTYNKHTLLDSGDLSTSFPNVASGILITNIIHDSIQGSVSFKISSANRNLVSEHAEENLISPKSLSKKRKK